MPPLGTGDTNISIEKVIHRKLTVVSTSSNVTNLWVSRNIKAPFGLKDFWRKSI
jgi:hypothetical protein